MEIVNCHVHTFTEAHTPRRFLPWPVYWLVRIYGIRQFLLLVSRGLVWVVHLIAPHRRTVLERYVQIVDTSYKKSQRHIFEIVRGFYPEKTRFVVLPMDMTKMNAGPVRVGIDEQHTELEKLRGKYPDALVVPFAAVDPRHEGIVEKTIDLIEQHGFRGLKLYPPTGYHPFDRRLWRLYAYAEENGVPALTHCSRPASVKYRGRPTVEMRTDPVTGEVLKLGRIELLTRFTDPDAYVPLLERHPNLRICLAHAGGEREWARYLDRPWHTGKPKS